MSMSVNVYHYDVFSSEPGKGNPAGVVLNGDDYSEEAMQVIANQVGFNETTFVCHSATADVRLRYFTPGHEMSLCGHGTMGAIFALFDRGLMVEKRDLTIETKAGKLVVQHQENGALMMEQAPPQFKPFTGSKQALVKALAITEDDLLEDLPIAYGSTGTWTLLVPVKNLDVCQRMRPHNEAFPRILKEIPKASVHPFCLGGYDGKVHMHARHFSSPFSSTVEDAVTGTASGVMGAYYATYIKPNTALPLNVIVEQGNEIGKDGRVHVQVLKKEGDSLGVTISGCGVFVKTLEVAYEA